MLALFDAYLSFYIEERGYFEPNRLQTIPDQLNIDAEMANRVEQASQRFDLTLGSFRKTIQKMTRELLRA